MVSDETIKRRKYHKEYYLKNKKNEFSKGTLIKNNCNFCNTPFEYIYTSGQIKLHCSNFCRNKKYAIENKEKNKIWKIKNKLDIRKKAEIYNLKNKEKIKEYQSKRYKIKSNDIKSRIKKYALNNPKKIKAQKMVSRDKKKRPHLYPQECCMCGVTENIEFHHPCYEFEYSVYPLCRKHHRQIHCFNREVAQNV